ncbi:hypothetical protein BC832DRAFT_5550 [Gaertneriomyces semiglobifer]|nr:hypothetical protein BC832DRAFT_5550 [Gaertneriomyces semiglobifer]
MYQCFDPTERRKRRELIAISRDIPRSDSGVELEEVDESVEEADLLAEKLRAIDVRPAPDEEEDEMENSRGRHHTRRRRDGSESPPPQRFRPEIGRALVRNGHAHLSSHGTANVRIPGPGFSQQPALFRRTVSTGFGLEQKASFQSPFHASVSHTPAPISRTISDPSPLEGLYTAFNNKTVNVRSQAPQERPMQNSAWGTTSQATERQSPLLNFSASFASSLDEVRTQNGPDHRPFNTKSIPLRQSSNISPRAHNGVSGVSPTTSFFSRAQTGGNGFRNQSASQPSWGLSNGSTVQQNASLSQRPFSFTDTQAASSKSMAQAPVPRHPPWTGQDYGPFGRIGPPPRRTPEQLPPPKPQTFWPFKSQTGLELLLDRAMQIQEHSVVTHTIRDFFNWRLYGYERVTKRMLLVALPLAVVGDYLCKPFLQLPCIAICAITFVFLRRHSSILRRRAIRTVERDAPKPYEMPERNPNADLDAPPVYSMLDELAHEESATAWEQANELRGGFEKLLKQVNGNAIKISTHRKEHMYIDLKIPGQGLRRSMSMLLTLRILLAVSFVCNAWHNSANFEPETFYTHEFHDTHSDDANPPMPAIAKFLMLLDTSLLGLAVGCWRPTIAPFEGVDGD